MLKTFVITSFVALLFVVGATNASAQWENLGSKEVTDRAESDVFHLTGEGQFRALRFRVARRPVRFYRMEITYGNGEKDNVQLRSLIKPGGSSRVIDVRGKDRFIRSVKFWYEAASVGRGQRSTITLFGRK
jgi:hypothetical protein